ncbi:MAG: dehydrogenase, partial [Chloroflexi bacterium]|nr:dehydrogenase [Chloroflexota bacterium]
MKSFFLPALGLFCVLAGQPSLLAAGRQLTGQHAPASTPALSSAEAQKKFTVPPGFEMRLFAAEPDVVNPVAMTWDERGRLWVVELYEYPLGAPAGTKPRDNIKVLEDTDGDGQADKVKTFADGLNLATGILLGNGGVYVGQAPHLLFLEDTNGDDLADRKTILMTGFGLQDRHELLNSFTWGPDGLLYMTHGVFTHSKVKDPKNPDDDGVIMNAAVARFDPRTRKFEVYADGTSNPWGVDFDRYGNAFVSACVIDHLFHLAPGGVYVRQGGTPAHPYTYQLLPSIVDHKHHMAAYSGVQVYQGDQYPEEYRGTIFMGNIHDNAVHQDRLIPKGSSFTASFIRDLVRANDGWFMPVSQQVGPDGALWIMDWYDKYPCYQNANADPEGVDREHGRIWRLVYTGNKPGAPVPPRPAGMNLAKLGNEELIQTLAHRNVWQRRMAQRLLTERRDAGAKPPLQKLLRNGQTLEARLAALWTLHSSGLLDDATLDNLAADRETGLRIWAARLTGERGDAADPAIQRLITLAADPQPAVRLAVAVAARQFVSGSLTVNTSVPATLAGAPVEEVLALLVQNSRSAEDPVLPFMIWMAAEPGVARDPAPAFGWLAARGTETMPLSGQLLHKIMLRVCDAGKTEFLDAAVGFLSGLGEQDAAMAVAGLDGLIEGQRGKALAPGVPTGPLLAKLRASGKPDLVERSQRLGTLWGDAAALREVLHKAADPNAGEADRIKAIQVARQMKNDAAREAMLELLARNSPDAIAIEALRALGELGGEAVAEGILDRWKTYTATARRAASETLVSRNNWTRIFLSALERKEVATADLPVTVIRTLTQSKDDSIRARAAKAIGRFREAEADKRRLIAEKKKTVIDGPVDLAAGHEVAQKTCFVCHKLHGEGA